MMRPFGFSTTIAAFGIIIACWQPTQAEGQLRQLVVEWKHVVATNGQAKLRVFTAGDGPSIVMLPARGLGPFELEPVAERLMIAGFRVVLPEPRGYGESIGPLDDVTMRDLAMDVARAIEVAGGAPGGIVGDALVDRVWRMRVPDTAHLTRDG